MPIMEPLPPPVLDLLAKPNPCVIAVLRADGAPAGAAVWYLFEDGEIVTSMSGTGARRRRLERDARVSVTVLDEADWYRQVTLHGEVADLRDDEGGADIDRISRHYTGEPYADHSYAHATARIRITGWNGFGLGVEGAR
jgi:PPOX class probable F420-dependent enzyme